MIFPPTSNEGMPLLPLGANSALSSRDTVNSNSPMPTYLQSHESISCRSKTSLITCIGCTIFGSLGCVSLCPFIATHAVAWPWILVPEGPAAISIFLSCFDINKSENQVSAFLEITKQRAILALGNEQELIALPSTQICKSDIFSFEIVVDPGTMTHDVMRVHEGDEIIGIAVKKHTEDQQHISNAEIKVYPFRTYFAKTNSLERQGLEPLFPHCPTVVCPEINDLEWLDLKNAYANQKNMQNHDFNTLTVQTT